MLIEQENCQPINLTSRN